MKTGTADGLPLPVSGDLYQACPLCGVPELREKYTVRGYTLVACRNCSVVFVRNILTAAYLQTFYQDQEGHCFYEDDNKDCLNYYNGRIQSEIEARKPAPGAILDVGCSSGYFLEQLSGWERHGVEISAEYGKKAQAKIGLNIFIGPFEAYPGREGYFDVITLFDVFDHFIDPEGCLKKCRSLLKPGGLLVIKVRNLSCLFAKISGSKFYAIEPPVHLFYFNEKSLRLILEKTSLAFIKKKFIGHRMKIKTIFFRLARADKARPAYGGYKLLEKSRLGNIAVPKNLHDIITVFAVKK
jgi:SAM-dependent methyltransferase